MMDKLPSEILTKIFGYLEPETLHTVSLVSMSWSRVTKSLGVCQFDFSSVACVKISDDIAIGKIKNEIPTEAAGRRIRHVLIHYHRILPNTIFSIILHLCPNVISFDYSYNLFYTHYFNALLEQNFHPFLFSPDWRNSIAHLPLCHDGREKLSGDTTLWERLESLTIHANSPLLRRTSRGNYTPSYRFPLFPHLTSLTLDTPRGRFKETTINSIVDCLCRRLTTLTLRNLQLTCVVNRKGVVTRISPNLQSLNLEFLHFLNSETYDYFPIKFPNVQELTIIASASGIIWLSPGGYHPLSNMICQFKRLTNLKVHLHDAHLLDKISTLLMQQRIQSLYALLSEDIHIDVVYT